MGRNTKSLLAILGILLLLICNYFFAYIKENYPVHLQQNKEEEQDISKGTAYWIFGRKIKIPEDNRKERLVLLSGASLYKTYADLSDEELHLKIRDAGMVLIFLIAILGTMILFFLWRREFGDKD